jgi:hypothetical protein
VQYGAALTFAFAGDNSRAQTLADRLAKDCPESTIVRFNYFPTLHAKLAVNRGNANEAIAFLRIATPYEMGVSTGTYPWAGLYPAFVRADNWGMTGRDREYVSTLQKALSKMTPEDQKLLLHMVQKVAKRK